MVGELNGALAELEAARAEVVELKAQVVELEDQAVKDAERIRTLEFHLESNRKEFSK